MESIHFPGFESWSTGGTCRRNIWAEQVATRLEVTAAGVRGGPPEPRGEAGAAAASVGSPQGLPGGGAGNVAHACSRVKRSDSTQRHKIILSVKVTAFLYG